MAKQSFVQQRLREAANSGLKEGDRVRILIDPPGGEIAEGTVRVVQKDPGKQIGVELDRFADRAHSLDGKVEERVDPVRGITVGKGWWTLPENVELLDQ